jgi:hypothetical protein
MSGIAAAMLRGARRPFSSHPPGPPPSGVMAPTLLFLWLHGGLGSNDPKLLGRSRRYRVLAIRYRQLCPLHYHIVSTQNYLHTTHRM